MNKSHLLQSIASRLAPAGDRLGRVLTGRPRALVTVLLALALVGWGVAGVGAWFSYELTAGLPGRKAIAGIEDMAQATTLYDAANRPVFTIFKEQRIEVPLSRMSPHLVRAIVAIEDQRFYDHSGADLVRVLGSALANLREGRRAQGASTITQQLARLSFLSRDKTFRRKLEEVLLAAQIERAYRKEDILALYLNKVYFGDGLYGAEAAARGFFGKPAADLDVAEAALLAGVVKSPSSWAPTINLERAVARRNIVLQAMLENKAIDRATYDRALAAGVRLRSILRRDERFGLYFKEQVRRELVERFGWERVYQGGLRVYTTIDSELQQSAEQLVETHLRRIEARRGYKHARRAKAAEPDGSGAQPSRYLQGALISLDPKTGAVLAMVGGRDFVESRFNRATQAHRQPGSAFKPFVFAAALEAGFTPATIIAHLDDPILTAQGGWVPEDEHSNASAMTMRTALRTSSNRAAVRLLNDVGISRTVEYVRRLNVGTLPSVPSLALGSGEVTLQSLTAAYGTFANGGYLQRPMLIRRVEDDESVLFAASRVTAEPLRAVQGSTAFLMAHMLADVISAGTGHRARREGFALPAAGKTGTTNDFVDAWFIGFTPKVLTGVWIGFDQPRTIIANGYASDLAVPLWADFMKGATRGHNPEWFDKPDDVAAMNICRVSGKVPNEGCSNVEVISDIGEVSSRSLVYTEYFVKGTQPTSACTVHAPSSTWDRIAGIFGADGPPPIRAEDADLPAARQRPASPTGEGPDRASKEPPLRGGTVESAPASAKKPGFWGRIFGRGGAEKPKKPD